MSECSNCVKWKEDPYWQTTGLCRLTDEYTASGYVCQSHKPAVTAKPKPEAKPAEFDIAKACNRVLAANLPRIDIVSVQAALRCQYRQAAEIIELLKEQGRIR